LISVLPYLSFSNSGIDGKATIKVSGANVQIVDGSGATSTVNGTGIWCWAMTRIRLLIRSQVRMI
jgi:hypothetical protein